MSSDPSRTPEENTDSPPPSSAAASRCEWACSHQQEMTSHSPPSPFACVCTDYFAGFSLNQPLLAPPVNLKDSENPPSSLRGERGEAAALLLKCRSIPGGRGGSGGRRIIITSPLQASCIRGGQERLRHIRCLLAPP